MEYERLKNAAEKITMSEEMKHRIAEKCKAECCRAEHVSGEYSSAENCSTEISKIMEEHTMKNRKNISFFKKPIAVFAALVICLSLSVTVLAETAVLQGVFVDITDFRGAVVDLVYEQADDEISLSVAVDGEMLTATVTFVDDQKPPYNVAEKLSISDYRIVDTEGNVIKEGAATEAVEIIDGCAAINIALIDIESGSYKLIVSTFTTEKKAERPLEIRGSWECAFTK